MQKDDTWDSIPGLTLWLIQGLVASRWGSRPDVWAASSDRAGDRLA